MSTSIRPHWSTVYFTDGASIAAASVSSELHTFLDSVMESIEPTDKVSNLSTYFAAIYGSNWATYSQA